MLQSGHDQSTSLKDWDEVETKHMDHILMVKGTIMTNQGEQNCDVQDQDHNGVKCLDKKAFPAVPVTLMGCYKKN